MKGKSEMYLVSVQSSLSKLIAVVLCLFVTSTGMAASTVCHPLLWPMSSSLITQSSSIPQETLKELVAWSDKLINEPANPVRTLGSSGQSNITSKRLVASRKAFEDADNAQLLALTWRLTQNDAYFKKTKEILKRWADVNQPTGNPIDESRLDGMIWAYDLISCNLSKPDKTQISGWLERIRHKKLAWSFGPVTGLNNYRIHQLKMLLLLDKVLQHNPNWQHDIDMAKQYSTINLNPDSGISVDYLERSALYYHNYVTQPWLEISLITDSCRQAVTQAFLFLSKQILSNNIGGEFSNSDAAIDARRAQGGFEYAVKGGEFDVIRAAPTIVAYYTMIKTSPEPRLWFIQSQAKPSSKMVFLKARRILWG